MFIRILLLTGALIAALVAFYLPSSPEERPPYIQGRNRTALFISNIEHGLSNVHIATASSLLENYPDIEVHYASFSGLGNKLARVSKFAQAKTPAAREITYHEIDGKAYFSILPLSITPPGSAGIAKFSSDVQTWISPWSVEEHMSIYNRIGALIDEIDPAVVILDTLVRPAVDSVRDRNWMHALITPQTTAENFIGDQPYGSMFWKYPALTSGFGFPVPYKNMLENIYLNFRFVYAAMMTPQLNAKKAVLRDRGVKDPINFFNLHRPDIPWITMTTDGVSIPLDVVPANVTCAGPILLSVAPAQEQDPELTQWVQRSPTVLIALGSGFKYPVDYAQAMTGAVADVLSKTDLQVLWKFDKDGDYSDDVLAPLQPFIKTGRLRMLKWLTMDIMSLLESGGITAFVHHGGSNCFNEGLAAGVPHVVLPLWADLYNFAAIAESVRIGIWACKDTSPNWTAEGISGAILKVADGGEATDMSLRQKSKSLGDKLRAGEQGRDIAAREIAKLAYIKKG
ncbi:unnamed protein product [Clonostachys solani]|uniref:Uncharacterized protein n=1 Tax=Clonostachys solani TaxID=160281 RepID=A0A9N9ZG52_9HYPO|nr:unnamed protein product [Clonostachys solani]